MPELRQYQYKPLSSPAQSIRLLTIKPDSAKPHGISLSLREASLADKRRYAALSYTWLLPCYDDSQPDALPASGRDYEVQLDEALIKVPENLFGFLSLVTNGLKANPQKSRKSSRFSFSGAVARAPARLRRPRDNDTRSLQVIETLNQMPIWIDYLCINQSNKEEREQQVLLMGDIFSKAEFVSVWLGGDDPPLSARWLLEEFMPLVIFTNDTKSYDWRKMQNDPFCNSKEAVDAFGIDTCKMWQKAWDFLFTYLGGRRWFERGWVVQEVALNLERTYLLAGTVEFKWGQLKAFLDIMRKSEWIHALYYEWSPAKKGGPGHHAAFLDSVNKISRIHELLQTIQQQIERFLLEWPLKQTSSVLLHWLVHELRTSNFSDDRDHIYATLGMLSWLLPTDISHSVIPDYNKPVEEVYTDIAWLFMRTSETLDALSAVQNQPNVPRRSGLPSWVADYSHYSGDRGVLYSQHGWLQPRKDHFAATIWSDTDNLPFRRDGRALVVTGRRIDTIISPIVASSGRMGFFDFKSVLGLLRFIVAGPATYPCTSEPRGLVMMSTILAGKPADRYEKHSSDVAEDPGDRFRTYLQESLVQIILAKRKREKDALKTDESVKFLRDEIPDSHRSMVPYAEDIISTVTDRLTSLREGERGGGTPAVLSGLGLRLNILLAWLTLYGTSEGRIGRAETSLKEGDELWLLEGGRVPFLLRETEDEAGRCYRLVGETYVHGIMFGELVSDEFKRGYESIRLV